MTLFPVHSFAQSLIPYGPVPTGLGVCDHNLNETPATLKMMYDAGVRVIRMDIYWGWVETTPGVYDFSAYDGFVKNTTDAGINILFILDYQNNNYDGGYSPYDAAGDTAYANYAKAAVDRYHGKGIIWELYNEPAITWTGPGVSYDPFNDASQVGPLYIAMASAAMTAIKTAYPNEIVVGPALPYFNGTWLPSFYNTVDFVDMVLSSPLGKQLDGVSVHPYRDGEPESVYQDYVWLSSEAISDTTMNLPIVNSEWGYASSWFDAPAGPLSYKDAEIKKGQYIARMLLNNLMDSVPINMVYDWMDDGNSDNANQEFNFGMVGHYDVNSPNPTIHPLPAYYAYKTLASQLNGYYYTGGVYTNEVTDYILEFQNGTDARYVCWNQDGIHNSVGIPIAAQTDITVTNYDGSSVQRLNTGVNGYSCIENNGPQYIAPAVAALASTTKLAISPSGTAIAGQSVTLTAKVSGQNGGPTPIGNVTFKVGSTSLGTSQLDGSGAATRAVTTLPTGVDTVTATYSGDSNYTGSTATRQITIIAATQPATSTVTVKPVSSSIASGASLNVTATVTGSGGIATGAVTLSGGGYTSSGTLASGSYTFTIPANSLSVGTDTLTASYAGDSNFASGTGNASVTVTQSAFTLQASTVDPVSPGLSATLNMKVNTTTGYSGTVTLACTLTSSPSGATSLPTCSGPGTALPVGGIATFTVTTYGHNASSALASPRPGGIGRGLFGAGGGAVLASLVLLWIPGRRRRWRSMLGVMVLMVMLGSLAGCGGISRTTVGATTAGTYTFTVTGAGNPAVTPAPTTTFTVTVN